VQAALWILVLVAVVTFVSAVGHRLALPEPLLLTLVGVVGFVTHWLLPDVPLAACFALGAVVAPPDAVAATSIARRKARRGCTCGCV
jgi:CPA1 family monovalent cation:H+ antiporter